MTPKVTSGSDRGVVTVLRDASGREFRCERRGIRYREIGKPDNWVFARTLKGPWLQLMTDQDFRQYWRAKVLRAELVRKIELGIVSDEQVEKVASWVGIRVDREVMRCG